MTLDCEALQAAGDVPGRARKIAPDKQLRFALETSDAALWGFATKHDATLVRIFTNVNRSHFYVAQSWGVA